MEIWNGQSEQIIFYFQPSQYIIHCIFGAGAKNKAATNSKIERPVIEIHQNPWEQVHTEQLAKSPPNSVQWSENTPLEGGDGWVGVVEGWKGNDLKIQLLSQDQYHSVITTLQHGSEMARMQPHAICVLLKG